MSIWCLLYRLETLLTDQEFHTKSEQYPRYVKPYKLIVPAKNQRMT